MTWIRGRVRIVAADTEAVGVGVGVGIRIGMLCEHSKCRVSCFGINWIVLDHVGGHGKAKKNKFKYLEANSEDNRQISGIIQ